MSLQIPELLPDPASPFPPLASALREPDGLLAFGGDLSPQRFLNAYANGIFPWYSEGEPILWWSPMRRAVFRTDGVQLRSKLRRTLRGSGVGRQVIDALEQAARARGDQRVVLSAQRSAEGFYQRLGYQLVGEPYDEVGIAHIGMARLL